MGSNDENVVLGEVSEGACEPCEAEGEVSGGDDMAAEIMRLKGELFCARAGIPAEISGDIIAAAAAGLSGEFSEAQLQEAVKAAFERISGAIEKSTAGRRIRTGVKSDKGGRVSDEALRRAFGIRG